LTQKRKRKKFEKEVSWNRKEINDIILNKGNKHGINTNSHKNRKALFLQKVLPKFADIPLDTIEQMILDMRQYKNINIFNTIYCPINDKIVYSSTIEHQNNHKKHIETKQKKIGRQISSGNRTKNKI